MKHEVPIRQPIVIEPLDRLLDGDRVQILYEEAMRNDADPVSFKEAAYGRP
jgi:hypothetical protein